MTDPTPPELFPTTTSSHQDILANHFPLRDNEEARKMRETSGDSCLRLSKENTRLGVFSRMFMVTLPWVSTKCYTTWKVKGTPHKRLLYQLVALMHPTSVIDSGLSATWPTPRARDYKDSINVVPPSVQNGTRSPTLGQKVAETRMWPTPNAWDGNRGPRSEKNLQEKNHMVNLITAVQTDQRKNEQEVGGTLNPMWVEWLMGYPPGWTDLED